jgi:hypothetical protein
MKKYLVDQNQGIENLVQFSLDDFDTDWKPLVKINPVNPTDCAANALCFLRAINRSSAQTLAYNVGSGIGMKDDITAEPTKEQQLNKARYYNIDPDFLLSIRSIKQLLQEYLNNLRQKERSKIRVTSQLDIRGIFRFFKKFLKEGYMTILNLGSRSGLMGHTVIICRGDGDNIFIFDPQNYDFFDNEHTIENYLQSNSFDYFTVYMETDVIKRKLMDAFDYSINAKRQQERIPKKARNERENYVVGNIDNYREQFPFRVNNVMTREQLAESGLGLDDGATPGFYPKLLPDGREIVGIHDQNDGTYKLLHKIGKMSDYDTQSLFSMGKVTQKSRRRRRKGGKKTINKKKSKAKTIKKKRRNK